MAELDTEAYVRARSALREMLADAPRGPAEGPEEQEAPEVTADQEEVVDAFFDEADRLAARIIEEGRARAGVNEALVEPPVVVDGLPEPPERMGDEASEEGAQIAALFGDAIGVVNDAMAASIGPGGSLADLAAGGPDVYLDPFSGDPVVAEVRDVDLQRAMVPSFPDLRMTPPSQLAQLDRPEPAPRAAASPPPPYDAEAMWAADHIFDEAAAHVGSNLLGASFSGLLDTIDVGRILEALAQQPGPQHASLLKRIIWRAARSVAGWVSDLIASAGSTMRDVAERLLDEWRQAHEWVGRPLVRSWFALDHRRTFEYLEQHGTTADPQSVVESFDQRMRLMTKGQKGISIAVGLLLVSPAAGPIIAIVSSLLGIWLASDHLGVPVGGFRGHPDWHHPDLAR